jgi:hypothetical protein
MKLLHYRQVRAAKIEEIVLFKDKLDKALTDQAVTVNPGSTD